MNIFELDANDWLDQLRDDWSDRTQDVAESPDVESLDETFFREVDTDTDDMPFWAL